MRFVFSRWTSENAACPNVFVRLEQHTNCQGWKRQRREEIGCDGGCGAEELAANKSSAVTCWTTGPRSPSDRWEATVRSQLLYSYHHLATLPVERRAHAPRGRVLLLTHKRLHAAAVDADIKDTKIRVHGTADPCRNTGRSGGCARIPACVNEKRITVPGGEKRKEMQVENA